MMTVYERKVSHANVTKAGRKFFSKLYRREPKKILVLEVAFIVN